MSARDFPKFLTRSLDTLERESPQAYHELCRRIGAMRLRVVVDEQPIWLAVVQERLETSDGGSADPPAIITSHSAIEALIEARLTLLDALLSDELTILAAPGDLPALHEAWLVYIAGAVRCRSFPGLLDEFLRTPADPITTPAPTARSPSQKEASHV